MERVNNGATAEKQAKPKLSDGINRALACAGLPERELSAAMAKAHIRRSARTGMSSRCRSIQGQIAQQVQSSEGGVSFWQPPPAGCTSSSGTTLRRSDRIYQACSLGRANASGC